MVNSWGSIKENAPPTSYEILSSPNGSLGTVANLMRAILVKTGRLEQRTETIMSAWSKVRLETMLPLGFTMDQWGALAAGTMHRRSKRLRLALPLPVATIKPAISRVLLDIARQDTPATQQAWSSDSRRDQIEADLQKDFKFISTVLLNNARDEVFLTLRAQSYHAPATPFLHADQTGGNRQFIARVGSLPFEAINGAKHHRANQATRQLIAQAGKQIYPAEMAAALETLRERKILEPAALDTVYLLYPEYIPSQAGPRRHFPGTLHCSAPVAAPTASVFIRASLAPPRKTPGF
jgi:hypothetical protein